MKWQALCILLALPAVPTPAQIGNTTYGTDAGLNLGPNSEYNTMIGINAGKNYTGHTLFDDNNTIIGAHAGTNQTEAINNTFLGAFAGNSNLLGSDCTFVGRFAGRDNFIGQDNTFIGDEAGRDNQKGTDNTFVGEDSGRNNIDGNDNTAIGSRTYAIGHLGRFNTAVGSDAGTEIGRHGFTLEQLRTVRNTCIGNAAGYDIGVGNCNTMIGDNAGPNTEHADFCTFVGQNAGFDNNRSNNTNDSCRNSSLGAFSGYSNRTGEDNLWMGMFADSGEWLPNYNQDLLILDMQVGPGWDPVPCFPPVDINQNVSRTIVLGNFASARDSDSIVMGYNARSIQTNSIVLGTQSRATGSQDIILGSQANSSHNNAITIGHAATSHGDNLMVVGDANLAGWHPGADNTAQLGSAAYRFTDVTAARSTVIAESSSDATIKLWPDNASTGEEQWEVSARTDGTFAVSSLATGGPVPLMTLANNGTMIVAGDVTVNSDERLKEQIQPVENALHTLSRLEGKTYRWKEAQGRPQGKRYGLIAQEVETVLPELVSQPNEDAPLSVNYQAMVPILINAVNELRQQNAALQKRLENQEQEIARISRAR